MKNTDALELLARVKPVDPPPFLFTRIEARLQELRATAVPRSWVTVTVMLGVLVLLLNLVAVRGARQVHGEGDEQSIASGLGISTSNQLYP